MGCQTALAAAGTALAALNEGIVYLAFQSPDDIPAAGVTQLHALSGCPDRVGFVYQHEQHGNFAVNERLFLVKGHTDTGRTNWAL